MNEIDVSKVDLNLLATLDALLTEGSVTRAARRLGVGQPAASHALGRLRELFDDPLFVRAGRAMVPTPRAEALRIPLARLLRDAARLVQHEAGFDPATTTRSFMVRCPDLLAPLLPPLLARLHDRAPRSSLEITPRDRHDHAALEDGRADLVLGPSPSGGPGLMVRGLGTVRFGIVARRDHPAFTRRFRLRAGAWVEYPHVMVRTGSGSRSYVEAALQRAGVERRVGLVVPSFLAALVTVAQTDHFFAAPRTLVEPLVDRLSLAVAPPPIEIPPVPIAALWHERYSADPAHRFLRTLVVEGLEAGLAGRHGGSGGG